jgi:hypothetical protein
MALNRLENINAKVNILMNESVEGLWKEDEVNTTHFSTGLHTGIQSFGFHSSVVSSNSQVKHLSSEYGLAPSLDTFLPALSESSQGVLKQCSGNSSQKDDRGIDTTIS